MEKIFTDIYESKLWGNNNNDKYSGSSGCGSDVNFNKDTYIPFLKKFIVDNNIKSVVDLGCGDFRCGPLIYDDLNISYTGYDAYNKVVQHNMKLQKYNFIHLDFYNNKTEIINGDLCILKDVIQHWQINEIYNFLDYLVENKKFKYILIINCCHQNQHDTNVETGGYRGLSCSFYPLKKYNAKKLLNYNNKEVSVIS